MSDQQLFQNTDDQEAMYAPHQLPEGTQAERAADLDDRGRDADTRTDDVGVPAAGAGLLGQTGGGLGSLGAGTPGAIGPVVGAAKDEDETVGPQNDAG